jgi:hypothetical protein
MIDMLKMERPPETYLAYQELVKLLASDLPCTMYIWLELEFQLALVIFSPVPVHSFMLRLFKNSGQGPFFTSIRFYIFDTFMPYLDLIRPSVTGACALFRPS